MFTYRLDFVLGYEQVPLPAHLSTNMAVDPFQFLEVLWQLLDLG